MGKLLKLVDGEVDQLGTPTVFTKKPHHFKFFLINKTEVKTTQNYLRAVLVKRVALNKLNIVDGRQIMVLNGLSSVGKWLANVSALNQLDLCFQE